MIFAVTENEKRVTKVSQKVKYRFEFEVSDSWKAGETACWTECPFSPLIGLGHTCKFLTTKELKCPFRDNKFKTLIERLHS